MFKLLAGVCDRLVAANEKEDSSDDNGEEKHKEKEKAADQAGAGDSDDSSFSLSDEGCTVAGDLDMYYSPLDAVHELYYVKTRLEGIARNNMGYYQELDKALTAEERAKLVVAMQKGEEYQKAIEQAKKPK